MVSEHGPYAITYYKRFDKDLRRLPIDDQRRIVLAVDALRNGPRPPGAKKLTAVGGAWRLRVGDYRVLYSIDDRVLHIHVVRLAHRRDAYRGLD